VVATALAGEMLGLSMIYLEAGSGAQEPVPPGIIKAVRENVTVPLAVGGGITTRVEIARAFSSGANLIILGNGCEKNPLLLEEACAERDSARQSILKVRASALRCRHWDKESCTATKALQLHRSG